MVQTCFLDAVAAKLNLRIRQFDAEGLLLLASHELTQELPAAFVFWRGLARQFFQAVCQLGDARPEKLKLLAVPPEEQLAQLVAEAPPMHGLEYLSIHVLQLLCNELRELVAVQAADDWRGLAGYLRKVNPLWHLLGRVTFHLAENKRDRQRPSAFLATYTHRLSEQSRLQHLPLAEARDLTLVRRTGPSSNRCWNRWPGRPRRCAGSRTARRQGIVRAAGVEHRPGVSLSY